MLPASRRLIDDPMARHYGDGEACSAIVLN
jgi:hypothetical protein